MHRAFAGPSSRLRAVASGSRSWLGLTILLAAVFLAVTLQTGINGSQSPYTTDVGEIQNALPRWGTIHQPGYPLYSLLGSTFVSVLRPLGIEPAAGGSLFSALWALVTVALVFAIAVELGAAPHWAALGALAMVVSTSFWAYASLAEVNTLGTVFLAGTVYLALRYRRQGRTGDLLGLALVFTEGISHQRTLAFLAPALALWLYPRWRDVLRHWLPIVGIALLALLVYLYLPWRAHAGTTWIFGNTGTWQGLLRMIADTKVERVVRTPHDLAGWLERARIVIGLLHADLWLPALLAGLAGVWLTGHGRRAWLHGAALTLVWLPSLALSLVIWEGSVSDALLAAKLPLALVAGIGLALLGQASAQLDWRAGALALAALVIMVGAAGIVHRPEIVAITRDPAAEEPIALAAQVTDRPATFLALWGHRYWALAYAQAYRGQLPGLTLVDHNADLPAITAREQSIFTLAETLYRLPLSWWDERLGHAHLWSPAPGIVAASPSAQTSTAGVPAGPGLDLGNGVRILSAQWEQTAGHTLTLTVYWQATRPITADYAVAVHLLAQDPPSGAQDILAQADAKNPVAGWYPTTRWESGEIVRDCYRLAAPDTSSPVAVRIGMYVAAADGTFTNTPWSTLKLP